MFLSCSLGNVSRNIVTIYFSFDPYWAYPFRSFVIIRKYISQFCFLIIRLKRTSYASIYSRRNKVWPMSYVFMTFKEALEKVLDECCLGNDTLTWKQKTCLVDCISLKNISQFSESVKINSGGNVFRSEVHFPNTFFTISHTSLALIFTCCKANHTVSVQKLFFLVFN